MKKKRNARALLVSCYFNRISDATPMDRFGWAYLQPLFAWCFRK